MNKLISLKDQDNNLINKQCVGIDTSNVLASGTLAQNTDLTINQDCFIKCTPTSTSSMRLAIDGTEIYIGIGGSSLSSMTTFLVKKEQVLKCTGYSTITYTQFGLKYL